MERIGIRRASTGALYPARASTTKMCGMTAVILVVILCSTLARAKVIYVDTEAGGLNDGTGWANAYNYLQDGLADANTSEKPVTIRVAQGVYTPDLTSDVAAKYSPFRLNNGIILQGGYGGVLVSDPNERRIELYRTILSGDVTGDDVDVTNPADLLDEPTRKNNAYPVVQCYQTDDTPVLDGVTVVGGRCNIWSDFGPGVGGAGMGINEASPTVINCTFKGNAAREIAGAVYVLSGSPKIIDCEFTGNFAGTGGAIAPGTATIRGCRFHGNAAWGGGAITGCYGSIVDSEFIGNTASRDGGAISGCKGVISNCVFIDNHSGERGGAIDAGYWDTLTLQNCLFERNQGGFAGAVFIYYDTTATVINCTFSRNSPSSGGTLVCYSWHPEHPVCHLNISRSIIWKSGNAIWKNDESVVVVEHSDIEGGYAGVGNLAVDPCFADPNNGDYHLKSQGGRYDSSTQIWVIDGVTSPCIDAGDPPSPIGPEPFPNGGVINMGAYGGTSQASKSYFGTTPCETIVAGDINGDCEVNFLDLCLMMLHWCEDNNP